MNTQTHACNLNTFSYITLKKTLYESSHGSSWQFENEANALNLVWENYKVKVSKYFYLLITKLLYLFVVYRIHIHLVFQRHLNQFLLNRKKIKKGVKIQNMNRENIIIGDYIKIINTFQSKKNDDKLLHTQKMTSWK